MNIIVNTDTKKAEKQIKLCLFGLYKNFRDSGD